MAKIETVGIVGFGVMGAAIGLNSAIAGYNVVFKELNDELLRAMYQERVEKPLKKKMEKGKITQAEINTILSRITGTSKNKDLSKCDLIIEAAVENLDSKIELLGQLDKIISKNTIIVSNTSTFLIENLMKKVSNPSRTAGLHYFFPANINRLVEVVSQKQTSEETLKSLISFAQSNGKIPITVEDFPGFAINPVFISTYMVLNSFYGKEYNVATLDAISKITLGLKFGIMWVQNGSGLSTCYHAAESMNHYLASTDIGYPAIPVQLKTQAKNNTAWNLEDGDICKESKLLNNVKDRLLGSIFAIATHLIEKKVVSKKNLELGITTALAWPKGPFSMMNEIGMEEVTRLVHLSVRNGDFKMPKTFGKGIPSKWQL